MVVIEVAVVDLATKSLWGCWDRNRLIIIKIFIFYFFKLASRCSVRCVSVRTVPAASDLCAGPRGFLRLRRVFSAHYRHLSVGACCFSESLKDIVA